jgi:ankyrin repeat protein
LLQHGASVSEKNKVGFTALHCAANQGHIDVVALLLRHGASVNDVNNAGRTALHCAAEQSNVKVVRALLAVGGEQRRQMMGPLTTDDRLQPSVGFNRPTPITTLIS